MQDSVIGLFHKLHSDVRESQSRLQKLRHDWTEVRHSVQVEDKWEAADVALREEIEAQVGQLWASLKAETADLEEDLKEVQSSIYVESLWLTERQEEAVELQRRAAKITKALG